MTRVTEPAFATLPAKRQLVITTFVAAFLATAILVTIVLPAEYGIDPLGTGAALGLAALSAPTPQAAPPPPGATALKPVQAGPIAQYAGEYKIDSAQFTLGPYEYVEYKYRLEQGASMMYSWSATATVIHDFHGEVNADPDQVQSFDKSDKREGHGMFTAPFSGIHGWYWENPGGDTITIALASSGFYSSALEFRFNKTRRTHELTPLKAFNPTLKSGVTTGP